MKTYQRVGLLLYILAIVKLASLPEGSMSSSDAILLLAVIALGVILFIAGKD